ncbi:MAG: TolC family protein, partial [Desulfobacterales bacterium]|nr:TolC family protein [Desulfobacterales bacterium]
SQSQIGQLRYDLLLLEDLERTEIARLNGFLNRHPDAALGVLQKETARPVVFRLEEIYDLAVTNQEELQIATVQVEKAKIQAELARYQILPDMRIGFFYVGIGNPDMRPPPRDAGDDAFGIQTGVTVPLWFGKNRGLIGRAQAKIRQAEAAKTARTNHTRSEIRALYFRLENAQRLSMLYRDELLPQAAKALTIAETWYREGQSSFSDFIETQAVWYNFQLALSRAQADYEKSLARLERLTGRSITSARHEIQKGVSGEGK